MSCQDCVNINKELVETKEVSDMHKTCFEYTKKKLEGKDSIIQDLRWALKDARESLREAKADDPRCFDIIKEALNKSEDCSLEERDKRMMSKGIEAATSILGLSVGV